MAQIWWIATIFLFVAQGAQGWISKKSSIKGQNVCSYKKVRIETVMRKNVTTTTTYNTKKCNWPGNPNLQCPETHVKSTVSWYPYQKRTTYREYNCCPGWSGYVPGEGCHIQEACVISLPQYDSPQCLQGRKLSIAKSRIFFKLSKPIAPDDPNRGPLDVLFPMLDQPTESVIAQSMMDPFTAHWFNVYFYGMLKRNNETLKVGLNLFKDRKFDSYQDYVDLYDFFIEALQQTPLPYFKIPSTTPNYTRIIDGKWKEDRYFVEQKLAGLNPMYIRRVTIDGEVGMGWRELSSMLNPDFEWEKAIKAVVGEGHTIISAIQGGLLYVIDYSLYHDIPHVVDITDPDLTDERKLRNSTSPITLFGLGESEEGYAELKVIAIQMDYKKDAPVYKPDDGINWTLAKGMAQTAEFATVEIFDHLLRTHVRMEPICVCFSRHLSAKHPLHQILKYHCRGMLPVNSYGFPRLTNELAYMHKLFAMGHVGTFRLLNDGYERMRWKDNDLLEDLKRRGVDDPNMLPYFPYRDDGRIIYEKLRCFTKDLIDTYYRTDSDVVNDNEVQSFMNELSADGAVAPDGGNGKIRGLPPTVSTKAEVADFIFHSIWLVVQHAAINYPIVEYGSFAPNMPTKLYYDPRQHPTDQFLYALPGKNVSTLQNYVSMNLGTIRYDTMFDYYGGLEDEAGKRLVSGYYQDMMTKVKPEMETRDRQRVALGHLSYPYLIPGWLPNSIHT